MNVSKTLDYLKNGGIYVVLFILLIRHSAANLGINYLIESTE